MTEVAVRPALLRWAVERSRVPPAAIAKRFPHFERWLRGRQKPTLRQLEEFAKATRTPVGFLFLASPPKETVPIPDFRTMGGRKVDRPSPDLLDTIYACQQRQEWYHDYALSVGADPIRVVGTAKVSDRIETAAAKIRDALGFDLEARKRVPTWSQALRMFFDDADRLGILVMVNGIVGTNTRRRLDPREFRGFALVDDLAPVVFVNGADSKSGQMFTLAHELAHLWLGKTGLSDADASSVLSTGSEGWCNRVAAELLVPLSPFKAAYDRGSPLDEEVKRLSREFKVSSLVILRRMRDAGGLPAKEFQAAYADEMDRLLDLPSGGGGDFYRLQVVRVGRRFAQAVVASAADGQTTHKEAFRLLGVSKPETLLKLGKNLGVM